MEVLIFFIVIAVIGGVAWIVHYFNQFDSRGFRNNGIHRNGTKYDNEGYDYQGYDSKGFNKRKMHKSGTRYNERGYDYEGYDSNGFNNSKTHKNGTKYDNQGFDFVGFNKDGMHKNGTKYDEAGYDIDGYNKRGFNNSFIHKNGTKYNSTGYDFHGYDKHGYTKDGVDKNGLSWWYNPKSSIIANKYYIKFLKSFTEKNIKNKEQASVFINNSFNILGLESSSMNNNIVRRAIEIEKFSKANINKSYDLDFFGELIVRSDINIKRSRDKLNNIKDRMLETFLWFDFELKDINKAIVNKNIEESLFKLKKLYDEKEDVVVLKNLTLLQIFYSVIVNDYKTLELTIKNWKTIIESKDYWKYFNKKIKDSQDFQIDDSVLVDFKDDVKSTITNFYFNVTKDTKLVSINDLFYDEFGILSDSYISQSLVKTLDKGKVITKKLEAINSKKNFENFQNRDRAEIERHINDYKEFLNDIKERNLSKYPEIRRNNDDFVKTIRSISVNIHNKAKGKDNVNFSKNILVSVKYIHVSDATTKLINKDIEEIDKNEEMEKLLNTITDQLKKKQYTSAEKNIEKLEKMDKSYQNLELVRHLKIRLFRSRANNGFKESMEEANRIAKSYTARYNVGKIISNLENAMEHLAVLHVIAENEKDHEELKAIKEMQVHIQSQIYQIRMSRY